MKWDGSHSHHFVPQSLRTVLWANLPVKFPALSHDTALSPGMNTPESLGRVSRVNGLGSEFENDLKVELGNVRGELATAQSSLQVANQSLARRPPAAGPRAKGGGRADKGVR